MTCKEKLAIMMARRFIRGLLRNAKGTMDFFEMTRLFEGQSTEELSNGEYEEFVRMRAALKRKDNSKLEHDLKELDEFKKILIKTFDDLLSDEIVRLGG